MTKNRVIYLLLVVTLAGTSALFGAAAGGFVVYRTVSQVHPASLTNSAPAVQAVQANNGQQTLVINTTDIETTITQAVQEVGPAVVTVVGTIPGQMTIFGQTGDQTVSGSGIFISDKGYILTNNHVVEGTKDETHSYINILFTYKPGDQVTVEFVRNGKAHQVQITLGESNSGS